MTAINKETGTNEIKTLNRRNKTDTIMALNFPTLFIKMPHN